LVAKTKTQFTLNLAVNHQRAGARDSYATPLVIDD
jgi:hypothetical protein